MPARHFTQSADSITFGLGNCGFAFGPGTIAAIFRRTTTPPGSGAFLFWAGNTNAAPSYSLAVLTNSSLNFSDAVTNSGSFTTTTNKWYLAAFSKASGTVACRAHLYDYATNTWTHQAATGTCANSGVPSTSVRIGNSGGGGFGFNGEIPVVGVWNIVLADAQVESLAYDLNAWFAPAQPKGLWVLDQDTVSQKVSDLSGGGANQTAIATTDVTSPVSMPVFSRGAPVLAT